MEKATKNEKNDIDMTIQPTQIGLIEFHQIDHLPGKYLGSVGHLLDLAAELVEPGQDLTLRLTELTHQEVFDYLKHRLDHLGKIHPIEMGSRIDIVTDNRFELFPPHDDSRNLVVITDKFENVPIILNYCKDMLNMKRQITIIYTHQVGRGTLPNYFTKEEDWTNILIKSGIGAALLYIHTFFLNEDTFEDAVFMHMNDLMYYLIAPYGTCKQTMIKRIHTVQPIIEF